MIKIRFSQRAVQDLIDILTYSLTEGFSTSTEVVDEIEQRIKTFATQPRSGVKGREPGTREWFLDPLPFVVSYTLQPNEKHPKELHILNIVHGARRH